MLSTHNETKEFERGPAKVTITRDFVSEKLNVRLDIGDSGTQLKSVTDIDDMISLLEEVKDDIKDDIKKEKSQ